MFLRVSEHSKFTENLEFVLFQIFQKLQKNDVKIKFWKSQKIRSDSKTDSNVWFKVHNEGPKGKLFKILKSEFVYTHKQEPIL